MRVRKEPIEMLKDIVYLRNEMEQLLKEINNNSVSPMAIPHLVLHNLENALTKTKEYDTQSPKRMAKLLLEKLGRENFLALQIMMAEQGSDLDLAIESVAIENKIVWE